MLRELSVEEFKNFNNNYNMHSIYQTSEYALVMTNQNFKSLFLGLFENDNIVGATMILIERRKNFKYAYAPRGFLINYNNFKLLETFTKEIKKYLGKMGITAIKLSPMIIKNTYDTKYNVVNKNPYFDSIFENLKNLNYYHFGYNNFFEALKPRYEAVIDISLPYYMLFNNIKKEFKTKIRGAEANGIKVYKGTDKNLDYLYLQTAKKYPRDLDYFKDCYKYFKKDNNIEFFFTKLDTNAYLENITKKYHRQEEICNKYNNELINNKNILSSKMDADKLLEKYKKDLIKATRYLRDYPDGIITSSALVIKNYDEVFLFMDGYDIKYKTLNSKHLLIWKLIERYSKLGFKKFNLGGITNINLCDNKYKGLNEFKIGFDSKCVEYIGDLELITNNALYFMYKNSFSIKDILKK